jgi:hypothetical protein
MLESRAQPAKFFCWRLVRNQSVKLFSLTSKEQTRTTMQSSEVAFWRRVGSPRKLLGSGAIRGRCRNGSNQEKVASSERQKCDRACDPFPFRFFRMAEASDRRRFPRRAVAPERAATSAPSISMIHRAICLSADSTVGGKAERTISASIAQPAM